jgi:uncharacterized membrane protein YhiD involved in acid resistance
MFCCFGFVGFERSTKAKPFGLLTNEVCLGQRKKMATASRSDHSMPTEEKL